MSLPANAAATDKKIRELIQDVVTKIQDMTNSSDADPKDTVYHIEMALFPLTNTKEKK